MSEARVIIWDQVVGYLYWDKPNNMALFESDESYIKSPINIAPYLHQDKSKMLLGNSFHDRFEGLMPQFKDSLPDSFGNVVFKEWLIQKELDQSEMNPIERLLYIGSRGTGALEYEISNEVPKIIHDIDLTELAEISDKIIKRKYAQEDFIQNKDALANILSIGSSVGGAQAKILVAMTEDGKLKAGDVMHPRAIDYYIIKLEHDPQNIWNKEKNKIELVYNEMARDVGINVAASKLIHENGRSHLAIKRFDRAEGKKIHMQTVSALTGFFGKNTEFSYSDIFQLIGYFDLPYNSREQLFTQMVFNAAASNRDDHTKNFSFLMNPDGQWSLSPAYDITFPFDPYQSFRIPHKIMINKKTTEILRSDLVAVAEEVGIRGYNQIINRVLDGLSKFENRMIDHDVSKGTIKLISKEINENRSRLK